MKRKGEFDCILARENNSLASYLKKVKTSNNSEKNFLEEWLNEPKALISEHSSNENLFCSLDSFPCYTGDKTQGHKIKGTFIIYTINSLAELIKKTRDLTKKEEVSLRFLLTPSLELLFAREGLPSTKIPPHFAMIGVSQDQSKCITAGNIKINKDNKISFVSNRSGNFHPSWDSLQFALCALLACGAEFADEIVMEKFVEDKVAQLFKIDFDRMKESMDDKFLNNIMKSQYMDINQSLSDRITHYPVAKNYLPEHGFFGNKTNASTSDPVPPYFYPI